LEDDARVDLVSLTEDAAIDDGWSEVESEEEEEDEAEESLDRDQPVDASSDDEDDNASKDFSSSGEGRNDNWLPWGDWVIYKKKFPEDNFVAALTWLMVTLVGGVLYIVDNRDLLQQFSDFFIFYYQKILSDIDS
jgi:hypothetical protein